jgi:hypothetical protein
LGYGRNDKFKIAKKIISIGRYLTIDLYQRKKAVTTQINYLVVTAKAYHLKLFLSLKISIYVVTIDYFFFL